MGGLKYGLLAGLFMAGMVRLMPQPLGSIMLWFLLASHGAFMAARIWRRMRLPYVTAALSLGVAGTLTLGVVSWLGGYSVFTIPLIWPLLVGLLMVVPGSFLLYLESRLHPRRWRAWNAAIWDSTVLDMLLGRHIPELR